MTPPSPAVDDALHLSPRITVLPIIHGSGDMAQEVRECLSDAHWDCVAVPLPPSVEAALERAIDALPQIHLVWQEEPPDQDGRPQVNYVPVDPCQAVVMAIRGAMSEGVRRAYIDREVAVFEASPVATPDPYALKHVSVTAYAAALMSVALPPQPASQRAFRIAWMAFQLHELELEYQRILCLCPVADWPWLRDAYRSRLSYEPPEPAATSSVATVAPPTLYFVLGELPFLTELYERRRAELRSDRHLSIDGIKELLLATRERWRALMETGGESVANWVTPQTLQIFLQYVRNLALLDRRLTPDLYSMVMAAKQIAGDTFALRLLETAIRYEPPHLRQSSSSWAPEVEAGIDKLTLDDGRTVRAKNRLAGPPLVWRSVSLRPEPTRFSHRRWGLQWDPFRQCSWPPEDHKIESFASHVREQGQAILGADLAKTDKFTTSLKDGIDLRESLRNWPRQQRPARTGETPARLATRMDIYVKELPPARSHVEVVVFLFEPPADPGRYTWRATWYAEHQQESTLCFFATDFLEHLVGPGIGQSRYGGAMFLYPPRPIPDIWTDPALEFAQTLEERLIAGAACHSREPHIVLVSPIPPRAAWRQIARRFGKQLIPLPLGRFSGQTIDRLRRFHVLNGHEIRSYAARFIH